MNGSGGFRKRGNIKGRHRCPLILQTAQVNCALSPPVWFPPPREAAPDRGMDQRGGGGEGEGKMGDEGGVRPRVSWKSEEVLSGSGVAWQTRWHL